MNGYSEAAEERWALGRLGAYLAEQERAEAEAEAAADEQAWYDSYYGDEQTDREERRYVSEDDVEQVSDQDRANLAYLDDLAQHSFTL